MRGRSVTGRYGGGFLCLWTALLICVSWTIPITGSGGDDYSSLRKAMIHEIRADVERTRRWIGKGELDPRVLEAMGTVPRHEFVPVRLRSSAYENRPLPIGYGQTISQPFIVALMTDLLGVGPEARVLEIGTGSGYQAAVLAELVKTVYTVEIIPELGKQARLRLVRLGYENVEVRIGDGYYGWPNEAPFDAIMVTAAVDHIPPPLIQQMKPRGRMVLPVGDPFATQQLILVEKGDSGEVRSRQILPVCFVPLTGGPRP